MKKIFYTSALIFAVVLILDPVTIFAQGKFEITPYGGYQFGGRARFYEGDLKIKDNANYGVILDVALREDTKIELMWSSLNTTASFRPNYGFGYLDYLSEPFDLAVNYFQIGVVREIPNDQIIPFGAFTMGTTYFAPQESSLDDDWRFSITLGGGAKIWLTERVGIRLQGRLMMPLYFAGGGLSCGIGTGGSGCGVSMGAGTTLLQGDFSGGLIIALGD